MLGTGVRGQGNSMWSKSDKLNYCYIAGGKPTVTSKKKRGNALTTCIFIYACHLKCLMANSDSLGLYVTGTVFVLNKCDLTSFLSN